MADLSRFLNAQARDYEQALSEIRAGRKRSHWIWYIFPQLDGLGYSGTARYYAIKDRAEAEAYMEDPVLSKRLIEISEALLELDSDDPTEVMGYPDDLKLRSSMTLFSMVSDDPVFKKVLDKFFGGEECSYTREYLR
ncbi:MAG: DUF1810 domain-containing protein [Oscillospiraceae bacterium]|nr:DUF1810 domain-containing protein [Oscillospiraceae bacterium]